MSVLNCLGPHPSFLAALQPWVSLGLLNIQSPLLSVFRLLCPLLYLHYSQVCYTVFRRHLFPIFPRLIVGFRNKLFLRCGVVTPTPNPQPGGPGYPVLSGSSPLTCLAWEALRVAYATTSIALRFMWPRKPSPQPSPYETDPFVSVQTRHRPTFMLNSTHHSICRKKSTLVGCFLIIRNTVRYCIVRLQLLLWYETCFILETHKCSFFARFDAVDCIP